MVKVPPGFAESLFVWVDAKRHIVRNIAATPNHVFDILVISLSIVIVGVTNEKDRVTGADSGYPKWHKV